MQAVESEKLLVFNGFCHIFCIFHGFDWFGGCFPSTPRRLRELENRHGETEALLARAEYQEEQRKLVGSISYLNSVPSHH